MKNELDDLLNSVFGTRTPRTGGKAPDAQKDDVPQLTLTPDNTPQARRAAKQGSGVGEIRLRTSSAGTSSAARRGAAGGRIAAPKPEAGAAQRGQAANAARPAQPASRHAAQTSPQPAGRTAQTPAAQATTAAQTPGKAPEPMEFSDWAAIERRAADAKKDLEELEKAIPKTGAALSDAILRQRQEIDALSDIQRISRELEQPEVRGLATPEPPAQKGELLPTAAAPRGKAGLEGFNGLAETLGKTVLGQKEYLQKLVIALKRPYVMGHTGESARSAFYVTGPADTGKRLSLTAAAKALTETGVFTDENVAWMDLSLYPTAAEEKLFLQDLYMALAAKGDIVAFENYERCQPAFLTVLANLVQRGKSPLAGRYVMQNGRLIDAGSALVTDAVGALTPRGKYLVLLDEAPVAKLADRFGAPFVTALGDVCETSPLAPESLAAVAKAEFDKMAARAKQTLGFPVTASEKALDLAAASGGRAPGAAGILAFWERTYRALAQYRLEHDETPKSAALDVDGGRLTVELGAGALDLLALLPEAYRGEVEAVKAELDAIIGLKEIKQYVLSLEDNFAVQARRKDAGLKTASVSMHMIFTGNPGTGKTTIARLVSKYLKAIGMLSGGQLVEVTRADLVGRYVGHTAPLTTKVLKSAVGGVLFIDEAYSLYRGKEDSFGLEAIDTLVKGMEDHRDDLIVILAGYSNEMQQFLTANSGLKSRFPNIIEFPDYTGEELLAIARLQAKGKGYGIDESCDTNLLLYFNTVQMTRARDAGNGRLARNKVEQAILNQSKRLAAQPEADLSRLLPEDFDLTDAGGSNGSFTIQNS